MSLVSDAADARQNPARLSTEVWVSLRVRVENQFEQQLQLLSKLYVPHTSPGLP